MNSACRRGDQSWLMRSVDRHPSLSLRLKHADCAVEGKDWVAFVPAKATGKRCRCRWGVSGSYLGSGAVKTFWVVESKEGTVTLFGFWSLSITFLLCRSHNPNCRSEFYVGHPYTYLIFKMRNLGCHLFFKCRSLFCNCRSPARKKLTWLFVSVQGVWNKMKWISLHPIIYAYILKEQNDAYVTRRIYIPGLVVFIKVYRLI